VIFLDLDGFKGINDQYGHLAGSGTLAEVGSILAEEVRDCRRSADWPSAV
jgi:diguanylate cyclase (GGDEF)-like protein